VTASAAASRTEPPARSLPRTLGLRDLILIVVGTVIGSGIFLVPSTVLRQTGGNVSVALLVWVVAGVLSLLGALTFAEMGAAKPDAGGLYVYIRDAFGSLPAFLYGWTAFFVIGSGSVATLAVAFTGYLRQLVPVSPVAAKVVAVVIIAIIMAVNVRGARQGADVQNVTTAIKAGAIVVMSILLLALGGGATAAPFVGVAGPTGGSLFSGVGLAMIGVLWAYEGWQ
jgi:APA family basic amino acid/polyamine antiporter